MEEEHLPYTSRSDARGFACPACGVAVDAKCVGARGKERESVHRERMNLAARSLGHHEVLTLRVEGDRLLNPGGDTVGHVVGFEIDLQVGDTGALVGNLRRGEGEGAVDVAVDVPSVLELKDESSQGSAEGQLFDAPSPEQQVWQHFLSVTGSRQRFDSTRRGVIRNALKLRTPDQLCKAIDALSLDPWWTENRPRLELRYALRGNHAKGESDEERIDKMIATAERLSVATLLTTMDEVVATVPSERHGIVREMVVRVNRMYSHPDDGGMRQLGEDALTRLRQFGLEPEVIERDGKRGVGGWRRVAARV